MSAPAARVLLGGGVALLLARSTLPGGPDRWRQVNHRGRTVSLTSGPAVAVGSALTGRPQPAALLAGLAAGAFGAYDDVAGAREAGPAAKGFRGHLGALRDGRVTAGSVKLAGIAAAGLVAAAVLPARRPPLDVLVDAGLIAGSANLLNLLDLRPGRALKAGLVAALVLGQPGPAAAAAVLLPDDLAERAMVGDAGANALGAVLGTALAGRWERRAARARALAALTLLTAASEVVSYSRVIDAVAPLRWFDRLGRQV